MTSQIPQLQLTDELLRAIRAAQVELNNVNKNPFSSSGFTRLTERIDEYIVELTTEAIRVGRRYKSDTISPAYVDEATQHLVSGKIARWHRLIGSLGGVFFGVGFTAIVAMINVGQYSARSLVMSIIAITFGLISLTYHVLRD